ncbi:hypothetical protein GCM10010302_19690 [Streptomyces polychromogenes]|uniref:Uncharacterized protein n=1 Tax=Streptomyces polychromogenes TaxID=67342 RepID=A0ABP3EWE5_9ACTN
MSVGGAGIPRLQDLAYVEVAALGVAGGFTFEQIRCALVNWAAAVSREGDTDGSFDERKWDLAREDSRKHVHNTVEVLKELMRLGWVEKHILPSTRKSAYAHAQVTFSLTEAGQAWAELVGGDRLAGYNALTAALLDAHPQFAGYLQVVGATGSRPGTGAGHLTIPLLRSDSGARLSHEQFLGEFVEYAATAAQHGNLGWTASRAAIDAGVRGYVTQAEQRWQARERVMNRKQFMLTCEEAIVRFAFQAAGCRLDYISHELLRRWTRFLGLANFSYYAPGPSALRFWATADLARRGESLEIHRAVGPQARRAALEALLQVWQEQRADTAGDMYLPIWKVRAAVSWRQRISDDEFDAAIVEALAGDHTGLGLRIHLDQASHGATPASTRPLVIATQGGLPRVFNVIRVVPAHTDDEKESR